MPIGDLGPELAVLLTAVATLLAAMALPQRLHAVCAALAAVGLAVAAVLALGQAGASRYTFSGTFALDGATMASRLLILGLTALVLPLAPGWLATDRRHGEFYAMLLFSTLGAMAMAGAADLMQLVIGVLLSSVTGYVLAAYHRDWHISLEAGMKYFLLGALANALLVFGVVLILGMAGTTDYGELAGTLPDEALTLTGLALVVIGLLFKLGAVPGHAWVPDVAEGAPVPAAAFLTVVPKIAAAVALARVVTLVPVDGAPLRALVAVAAALTMTLGNLGALWQDDVRRLLGWSSVSQSGYALMAVAVLGTVPTAAPALLAFLGVYGLGNVAAFAVVAYLRGRTDRADYTGLLGASPVAFAVLALAFLSFVGIPPLGGFLGKFALFRATIEGGLGWLALVAAANSVLSLFYYLRVIGPAMRADRAGEVATLGRMPLVAAVGAAILVVLAAPLVWQPLWAALPVAVLP